MSRGALSSRMWPWHSGRFGWGLVLFLLALGIRLAWLPPGPRASFVTFYPAAVLAFYGLGTGPGILVVVASALAGGWMLSHPHGVLEPNAEALWSTLAFAFFSLMVGAVVHELRSTGQRLQTTLGALRAREQQLSQVLDSQEELICRVRRDHRLVFVNDAFCHAFGADRDRLLGQAWSPSVLAEDWAELVLRLRALTPATPRVGLDYRFHGAQGRVRWGHFEHLAFFDAAGQLTEIQVVGRDITDRKALQMQLAEATERIQDLYDNAPCGYCSLDSEGRFVHLNAMALSWLGAPREALVGQHSLHEFLGEASSHLFRLSFPLLQDSGQVGPLELRLESRDGTARWISMTSTAVRDAAGHYQMSRSVMYDITELHDARIQLQRLNREQSAMLDNELIGIVKVNGREVQWKNHVLERMFGYEHDELLGQDIRVLYADEETYRRVGQEGYRGLHEQGQYRTQVRMLRKNGDPMWVDLSGTVLSEDHDSLWLMLDITEQKEHEAQVEHIAFHDALTGLPNRLLLVDRLSQAMAVDARLSRHLAVCYLDLDGFKAVNDQYGHEAGDRLLQDIARRLETCVRANDTVARIGGDEFVLLLCSLEEPASAQPVLERVVHAVSQPVDLGHGRVVQISTSVGVAFFPGHARSGSRLLALADAALYEAKHAGRNCIRQAVQPEPAEDLAVR
ncbi:diguanylate cyclase [Ideonella sp. B7]|uniref:diguanylate cyclase domain-containing protein n=1 Tax=Ideonella benzenivorans TaxID=2831643 RepID=UPI001CED55A6|nr:diguanylate cyclase [Ideonella benzenivorans]MCA6215524.1 diguanylate cyclase [Ideonella benzenivorans]